MELVFYKNDQNLTSSRLVANYFNKDHGKVIRSIENLQCSTDFTKANFGLSHYKDKSGKKNKEYAITKDGFTFLAMGFTGKKAAKFKEDYINAFNNMELWIKDRVELKRDYHYLTDAIMLNNEHPKAYHFSNENFMLYDVLFGKSSRKLKKDLGVKNLRDTLDEEQVNRLYRLQSYDTVLIEQGVEYLNRKNELILFNQKLLDRLTLKISA